MEFKKIESFTPDASEVDYIVIKKNEDMGIRDIYDAAYLMELVKEYKVKDKEIVEMLCESLEYIVNSGDADRYGGYKVGFCVDGKVHYRYINFNENLLIQKVCEDENVLKEYKKLPKYEEIEYISMDGYTHGYSELLERITEEMLKEVYELYVKDLSELSREKIAGLMTRNYDSYDVLEINYCVKDNANWLKLPLIPELKNSYDKYLEILYGGLEIYNGDLNEEVYELVKQKEGWVFSLSVMEGGKVTENIYIDIAFLETVDYSAVALKEKWLEFCEEVNTSKVMANVEGIVYIIEAGGEKIMFSANEKCYEIFKEMRYFQ